MAQLSIVIPVKDEEKNIEKLIREIRESLSKKNISYEIIFVDDHSSDRTVELLKDLQEKYPIQFFTKRGKPGKAYSIIEGARRARNPLVCMIDADLQYDPRHIPEMLKRIVNKSSVGVVIAERKEYRGRFLRRFGSRINAYIFGGFLFSLRLDVQSGLKIFRKEILDHIEEKNIGPWSLDIPFLVTARDLGYNIEQVPIIFEYRENGQSKINMLNVAREISYNAIKLKLRPRKVHVIEPASKKSMLGAGVIHKGKRYITHSALSHHESALHTLKLNQALFFSSIIAFIFVAAIFNPIMTMIIIMAILSAIYFLDMLFSLNMVLKSLRFPHEISIQDDEIQKLDEKKLPFYTILCPLYREAHMIPQFVKAISNLDWPKDKLEVMLLLEEDDAMTISAAKKISLPPFVRILIVPDSQPKTKPKATNYGLAHAKGDLVVIFDAEDIPDIQQLKKVIIAFEKSPPDVICIQAKLNYYNPHQNVLTRIFTAEYSLWFDLILTGLQSVNAPIPLGGTSNHFKTAELIKLKGWDSFNVTEDCDLGIRLAKYGYKTAIVDSVTLEEANSRMLNWLHQRSRWIKGYIQSYLVHMRDPLAFYKKNKRNFFTFQLTVGGKILSLFINPIMWLTTILYFTFRATFGITIEKFFPAPVLYMAVLSLVFGNFLYLYYYMIGCAKRGQWQLIKYIYLVPLYWLAMSIAAWKALIQLIYKPHFWSKTVHGFHLDTKNQAAQATIKKTWTFSTVSSGSILVMGYMMANILNFLFNLTLGRLLSFEDFGLLIFVNTFTYLISILLFSLASTLTHRISYLSAKHGPEPGVFFLKRVYVKSIQFALIVSTVWTLLIPFMTIFFQLDSIFPLLMFFPILFLGLISSLNEGYLQGNFFFISLAIVIISAPLLKLLLGLGLTIIGFDDLAYLAIPISTIVPVIISSIFVVSKIRKISFTGQSSYFRFPKRFFAASVVTILSTNLFLTMDVLLTKHYLTTTEVGEYALIGLIGKIVFYFGSILSNFMMAFVSRDEGAHRNPEKTFNLLLSGTILCTVIIFTLVGPLGSIVDPIIFGNKVYTVLPYVMPYALAMSLITISNAILIYHLARHHYIFPLASLFSSLIMVVGVIFIHARVSDIVHITLFAATTHILFMLLLHSIYKYNRWIKMNIKDFLSLFVNPNINLDVDDNNLRILIFNWYCIRHTWAGGAEYYLHNIAKSLVKKGHSVTFFCGNDGTSKSIEVIDGVQIVRHGGLFTVGIWAFVYYVTKFKHRYDVIIDAAKGVPFFTPLYAKQPVISLICHIHKDMFKKGLPFPLAQVAIFLENKAMPFVYKNVDVVTISPSIRAMLKKTGFGQNKDIHIVYPGVNNFSPHIKKSVFPSLIYLGRLRDYKRVDILVKATQEVKKAFPNIKVIIAGNGESEKSLKRLVRKLNLEDTVVLTGKVTEKEKIRLLSYAWLAIHPSVAEGWGISNIEANICGTPVIASNIDGLRDSVVHGRTGLLVEPENISAFSQAIMSLLGNARERNRMSRLGIQWAQKFNWDISADEFYKIFHTMIIKENNLARTAPSLQKANMRI